MDELTNLQNINWFELFIWFVAIVLAFQFLYKTFVEGIIVKFGWKTRKMREREAYLEQLKATTELAKTTAENLAKLQTRHTQDETEFRNNLNNYMIESRADRKALHDEMTKYSNNRVADRQQSLQIQKELISSQKGSDEKIEKLTSLFLEKEISDMRWEIINVADKIANGHQVSRECLKHAIATHSKYEEIIEEHGLTNGEVDISMKVINEEYLHLLKEGA